MHTRHKVSTDETLRRSGLNHSLITRWRWLEWKCPKHWNANVHLSMMMMMPFMYMCVSTQSSCQTHPNNVFCCSGVLRLDTPSSLVVQVCPSRESYITGEACQWLVKAPLSMTLSLPFFPLSQYPHDLPLIHSLTKCLLHILTLKSSVPLINPSFNPSQNACFQMRPNGESGNFTMLSSVTGGSDDDAAVVVDVDAGTGSNTAGGAWLTGFFFNVVFFSNMAMYGRWW